MKDPYLYPNSDVLNNLQGIQDTVLFEKAAYDKNTLRALQEAEDLRANGVRGISVDTFKKNMKKAIKEGAANAR